MPLGRGLQHNQGQYGHHDLTTLKGDPHIIGPKSTNARADWSWAEWSAGRVVLHLFLDEDMASGSKKQRLMYNEKEWISSIMSLCTCDVLAQITLTPMKILNCNATAKGRTPFTRAFCDTEYYPDQDAFVFGDVFQSGINVLVDYFCKDIQPNNQQYSIVLEKLLDFMNGGKDCYVSYF